MRVFPSCPRRCGALWIVLLSAPLAGQDFTNDVAPILAQKCISCHGAGQKMAALYLSPSAAMLKGGQNGPAVVAGSAEGSSVYRRIAGLEQPAMPLGSKLSAAEIASIKEWIDRGS